MARERERERKCGGQTVGRCLVWPNTAPCCYFTLCLLVSVGWTILLLLFIFICTKINNLYFAVWTLTGTFFYFPWPLVIIVNLLKKKWINTSAQPGLVWKMEFSLTLQINFKELSCLVVQNDNCCFVFFQKRQLQNPYKLALLKEINTFYICAREDPREKMYFPAWWWSSSNTEQYMIEKEE